MAIFGVRIHNCTGNSVFFNRFIVIIVLAASVFISLTCGRHNTDEIRRAETLFSQAAAQEKEFHYREADELYRQAAELFESNNEPVRASDVFVAIGAMEHNAGNFQQAIEQFTRASGLAQNAGDHGRQSATLVMIAEVHSELGQTDQAIAVAKQSLVINEMFGEKPGAIVGYNTLGRLHCSTGLYRQAIEYFSKARTTAQSINKPDDDLDAALSLCEVALDQKQFIDALQLLALIQPQVLAKETNATHRWYLNEGIAYLGINDYIHAANAFSHAIALNELVVYTVQIRAMLHAAEVNYLLRRSGDALNLCADALNIARQNNDRIAEACLLLHRGDIERFTSHQQSLESYRQAAELFSALEYPAGMARALQHLGKATEENGNLTAAVEIYRKALDAYEQALTQSCEINLCSGLVWTHDHMTFSIADDLSRTLIELNRSREAFIYHERGLLAQCIATIQSLDPKPHLETLTKQFKSFRILSGELAALKRERTIEIGKPDEQRDEAKCTRLAGVIKDKSAERENAIQAIEKEEPNSSFFFRIKNIRVEDIQAQIPPGMILLEYIPAEIQLYCAVVTRTSFSLVRIPTSYPSILQHADELRRILFAPAAPHERPDIGNIDDKYFRMHTYAKMLYNELLGSIQVPDIRQSGLVIVPPPELSDIPFHALISPGTITKGEYVAEHQLIRYLPFASAALFQSNQKRMLNDMVAVGNPSVTNWEVDYVLRDIKTFFKEAKLFLGPDATRENLFGSNGDVLHIATDFLYDGIHTRNSYISLADGKTPNGSVDVPLGSLHALYNYPCIIIMNVGPSIESVNQFHMALLLLNGTRAVIGTFWQPERGAVRAFDEQFYSSLANHMSPESAYLQAQREMIAMPIFRPPHQWAPFFYYGI
ncbi:MAG: tetratricopeptide repeat protein [Bacteroidota bacterium]